MLSPSAPSASLLKFLRSQSGFVTGKSRCIRAPPRVPSHDALKIGSRNASTLTRLDQSRCSALPTTERTSLSSTRSRSILPSHPPQPLITSRNSSTARRPFLRRLLDLRRGKTPEHKPPRAQGHGLFDDGTEGIFNSGRGLAAKASNELRIRCTEFDLNGDVTLINGEFRKLELIAKVCAIEFRCCLA